MRYLVCIFAIAVHGAATLLAQPAPSPACSAIDLNQNWGEAQRQGFWFTTQGSRIMPYQWFLALEAPWADIPFRGKHVMDDLLGYISAGPSAANPDALPIGFARDDSNQSIGLTCAACHTARLEIGGAARIVEGAPAGADFATLLSWLVDALERTLADPAKFNRFFTRVADGSSSANLRQRVEGVTRSLRERRSRNRHAEAYGYARVDAFGHILNELAAKDLNIPENRREPGAPVSYPFLWDTPRHDRVQWNGVAPNIGNIGPMFRNIGEAIGVFGEVRMMPQRFLAPLYPSSIRVRELGELEEMLRTLWSPVWPRGCLPVDESRVARGRATYANQCAFCHQVIDRKSRSSFAARMTPLSEAGTDPTMANNFINHAGKTGRLEGTPVRFPFLVAAGFFRTFGPTASGADMLGNAALGVYLARGLGLLISSLPDPASLIGNIDRTQVHAVLDRMNSPTAEYKARPLNGVWATAPYLHNGSVPNLEQLLVKPEERVKQFWVGSRRFDAMKVGLADVQEGSRQFLFDANRPGNSNGGHAWGTGLAEEAKKDLIEYLKTL